MALRVIGISREAMDEYGVDKPDLRFGMTLQDLSDVFEASEVKAFAAPTVKAIRVIDGANFSRSRLDQLTDFQVLGGDERFELFFERRDFKRRGVG
mgnify:CR=1 FL=1